MDPRGKCVLNLRIGVDAGMESDGTGSSGGKAVAEVLSDKDGSVLHLHEKRVEAAAALAEQQQHEWHFQNMKIVFDAAVWELSVTVTNSRSVSCFSSIHGGKLLKGIP
jgi:hypothetical protein